MARALSDDLRKRVLEDGVAGASASSIATRFGVGISTAIRWLRRDRENGEWTPHRQGKPRGSCLDAHEAFIADMIKAQKDITLQVIPFFAFNPAIRKIIYTTNAIESLNQVIRKSIKTRGSLPTDEADLPSAPQLRERW